MIPTRLRHTVGCTQPTAERDRTAAAGVVVYRCPECGARASSRRAA